MRFSVYQVSRRGGRVKNEDRVGYCYTREAGLFALADGMGGHPEGEVAAQLGLQTLATLFQHDAKTSLEQPLRWLQEAFMVSHEQLLRYASRRGLPDTPRTTLVGCLIQGRSAYWAHCGDSRLYLVREGKLVTRTRDHSYSELRDALAHVSTLPPRFNRNVLYTCLGSPSKPVIDTAGPILLQPGDRLLLCSDGLWGSVPDEAIIESLAQRPVSEAVPELVEQALLQAGARSDNVTVLGLEWEAAGDGDSLSGVSTRELHEDAFASTIQANLDDKPVDDLGDADIERSIREINEAIHRGTPRGS